MFVKRIANKAILAVNINNKLKITQILISPFTFKTLANLRLNDVTID